MQPRIKIGLITGVIGLVLNICVSGFFSFCGPVVSLIAGGIAGYIATRQEKPETKKEGARIGATAGGVAGALITVGQLVGEVAGFALVPLLESTTSLEQSPSSNPIPQDVSFFVFVAIAALCFGIVGTLLAVGAGAAVGHLATSERPVFHPSRTAEVNLRTTEQPVSRPSRTPERKIETPAVPGIAFEKAVGSKSNSNLEKLVHTLKYEKDPNKRAMAAQAFQYTPDRGAVEPLIEALQDDSWGVRMAAIQALREIGDQRAIEPLSVRLQDENSWVREAAAKALEKLGVPTGLLRAEKSNSPRHYYFEKDNLGTRYDTTGRAEAYWTSALMGTEYPFVIFYFDKEEDARRALLELPGFHVAEDSQKLICTEVLDFGYYPKQEGFAAFIRGRSLTHDLWERAMSSFTEQHGTHGNDLEPDKTSTPIQTDTAVQLDKVVFLREERKQIVEGVDGTYRFYRAPDAATAKAFLQNNPVTQNFYYINVETPEGNYSRDIQGIYEY